MVPGASLTSPYPRGLRVGEEERLPSVGRRVAWDGGIAVMGLIASLYFSMNYPDRESRQVIFATSAFLTVNVSTMILAQKRGEARLWQSLGFHFLGVAFGCLALVPEQDSSFYAYHNSSLRLIQDAAMFSALAYILLGGLSPVLGSRLAMTTVTYEAVRHSWSTILIAFPVLAVIIGFALSTNSGVDIFWFQRLVGIALVVVQVTALIRTCRSLMPALAYIWTPIVLGSPIVLMTDWLVNRGSLNISPRYLGWAVACAVALSTWARFRKWSTQEPDMPLINSPDSQSSAPAPTRAP